MRIAVLLALVVAVPACSADSSSQPDMMDPPDLTPPPPDLTPPPRAASDHPDPANVTYGGGHVLKNPELVTVVWGNDPLAAQRGQFADWFVTSPYLGLLAEYGVHNGTHLGIFHITDPAPATLDDSQIPPFLRAQIKAGNLPAPTSNTIYLLYLPAGTQSTQGGGKFGVGCVDYDAYHYLFPTMGLGSTSYSTYALMPACVTSATEFDNDTIDVSHELAEAATDPLLNGYADPTIPLGEIGDLCTPLNGYYDVTLSDGTKRTYVVNRIWSQQTADAGTDDPCLPKPPSPYAWFGVGMTPNLPEVDRDASGNGTVDVSLEPFAYGAAGLIQWDLSLVGPMRGLTFSKTHGKGLAGSTQVVTITANSKAYSGTYSLWITAHDNAGYDAVWFGALTVN